MRVLRFLPFGGTIADLLIRYHRAQIRRLERKKRAILDSVHDDIDAAVGRMTLSWASMEYVIDAIIFIVHNNGGSAAVQDALPVSLKSKREYLRRAKRIPAFHAYGNDFDHIRLETKRLDTVRHDLVHGIVSLINEDLRWTFKRFQFDGGTDSVRVESYNMRELNDATKEVVKLTRWLIDLFDRATAEFHPKDGANL